ncbi:MAG: Flp family type IVb pilin [Gemmobacter sp.]
MLEMGKRLKATVRRFARDESGAVTVDWVVLTAAIVGAAIALHQLLTVSLYQDAGLRIAQDVVEASVR